MGCRFDLLSQCSILCCHPGEFQRLDQDDSLSFFDLLSRLDKVAFDMSAKYRDDLLLLVGELCDFGIGLDDFAQWLKSGFFYFNSICFDGICKSKQGEECQKDNFIHCIFLEGSSILCVGH